MDYCIRAPTVQLVAEIGPDFSLVLRYALLMWVHPNRHDGDYGAVDELGRLGEKGRIR